MILSKPTQRKEVDLGVRQHTEEREDARVARLLARQFETSGTLTGTFRGLAQMTGTRDAADYEIRVRRDHRWQGRTRYRFRPSPSLSPVPLRTLMFTEYPGPRLAKAGSAGEMLFFIVDHAPVVRDLAGHFGRVLLFGDDGNIPGIYAGMLSLEGAGFRLDRFHLDETVRPGEHGHVLFERTDAQPSQR